MKNPGEFPHRGYIPNSALSDQPATGRAITDRPTPTIPILPFLARPTPSKTRPCESIHSCRDEPGAALPPRAFPGGSASILTHPALPDQPAPNQTARSLPHLSCLAIPDLAQPNRDRRIRTFQSCRARPNTAQPDLSLRVMRDHSCPAPTSRACPNRSLPLLPTRANPDVARPNRAYRASPAIPHLTPPALPPLSCLPSQTLLRGSDRLPNLNQFGDVSIPLFD